MIRRTLFRLVLAFLGASLLGSFHPAEPPTVEPAKSRFRVTRHFAGGFEYLSVEPRDLPPDAELPMLVYLHGRGSHPIPPVSGPMFGVDVPVRLILPRGPDRHGDGYAWMPVSAHRGETPPLVDALRRRSQMLADAMDEWRARHPTRGQPIVVGFSQGGMLAMDLAVHHPGSIGRAFPIAGWLPPSRMPSGELDPYRIPAPIFALHGGDDPVLSAPRTRAVMQRLRSLGYPVTYHEIGGVGHELPREMQVKLREAIEEALRELPESGRGQGHS